MKYIYSLLLIILFSSVSQGQKVQIGLLKYNGGGDWYANPTALPNLIQFCNRQLGTSLGRDYITVEVGSPELFNIPFLHMTGHGNVVFSDAEAENLRTYLVGGGFLHIDDNYGMDPYIRVAMKKVFPELDFVELPYDHPIYHQKFSFPSGVPKIHEHDNKPAKGFGLIYEGELVCFYSYESDIGDGWEDESVHNDPPEKRLEALRMGANILQYSFIGKAVNQMHYLIWKSLHIIGVVSWFAGLFYLVRLFVYYRESLDREECERKVLKKQLFEMINRLFRIITTPAMVLTVIAGVAMLVLRPGLLQASWMHAKLGLVLLLLLYHFYCYRIIKIIEKEGVLWKSFQFRLFNEIATVLLVAIVFLVVMKNAFNALYGILGFIAFALIIFIAAKMYKNRRESKLKKK